MEGTLETRANSGWLLLVKAHPYNTLRAHFRAFPKPLIPGVMPSLPFHLQYDLNRRQRLVPHLAVWTPYLPGLGIAIVISGVGIGLLSYFISMWFLFLLIVPLWIARGFIVGICQVILVPVLHMDIIIEENGLGYLLGQERRWIFLDGILRFKKYYEDTWTIFHFNGTMINIPGAAMTDEQIEHLKLSAARARDPETIQTVIERGRQIERIERQGNGKKR